jgi:hypothetical protein
LANAHWWKLPEHLHPGSEWHFRLQVGLQLSFFNYVGLRTRYFVLYLNFFSVVSMIATESFLQLQMELQLRFFIVASVLANKTFLVIKYFLVASVVAINIFFCSCK